MSPFETEMNKAFQKLAVDVIPPQEVLMKANICADQIIRLLQQKSKFDIGRVVIGGSTGKKTTIINSDVDLVIFFNGERPPFKGILDDFENIFTLTDSFKIRDVHKTKYSIQFKAMDFEFDILPAANFTVGLQLDGDTMIDIQRQLVLQQIEKDPKKNGYMYSSSLADAAVRFMKGQSGFVHEFVRIAKFWYKTLHFGDYVSGAKSLIELVAVFVANQEENMGRRSHLSAFNRFITHLQNFENLNVYFENEHRVLDKSRPRVIDPVNPYNNLAMNWGRRSIDLIKGYAKESNRRLDWLANVRSARLDQLFEPQPVYRPDIRELLGYDPNSSNWLVSTTAISSRLPDLKVRNERFHTNFRLWNGMESVKKYFQFAICASTSSGYDANQTQEVVQRTIDRTVYGSERTWSSSNKKHDDFDITFTIPSSNQKSIRISYKL